MTIVLIESYDSNYIKHLKDTPIGILVNKEFPKTSSITYNELEYSVVYSHYNFDSNTLTLFLLEI